MKTYWSLSKFADSLRKVFGLPEMLSMGTSEEWEAFHKLEKETSRIGLAVIESLDVIQNIVYWIPRKITDGIYWISNVKDSTHVLRTTAKLGGWSDLTQKIPDGLMYGVIDFIEKECFWMEVMGSDYYYSKQSYIRWKLFSMEVSSVDRMYFGLKWLDFQIENSDEDSKVAYQEIIDAYSFAKYRYFTFDAYEESGYMKLFGDSVSIWEDTTEDRRKLYDKINQLEADFYSETTKHCSNLVKNRNLMWV